jgi:hypothetical protein
MAMEIGEIAAPAAGDENLLANPVGALEDRDASPALSRLDGAHQPSRAAAKDQCVKSVGHWGHKGKLARRW